MPMWRFGHQPSNETIRDITLRLSRLTRWSRESILNLDFAEAQWWLDGAIALEREINNV